MLSISSTKMEQKGLHSTEEIYSSIKISSAEKIRAKRSKVGLNN